MSTRTRRILAALLGITAVVAVIASALLLLNTPPAVRPSYLISEDIASVMADRFAFLGVPVIATVILIKRPDVRYGWVLMVAGLGFPLGNLGADYAVFAVRVHGALPAASIAGWVANWAWLLTWAVMPFSFLLFPDGKLPSPRWRPFAVWATTAGGVAFTLTAFAELPIEAVPELENPFGFIPVPDESGWNWFGPLILALMVTALVSILSVVIRFVRSRGDERQQLKWFAFATSLLGAYLVANNAGSLPSFWGNVLGALVSLALVTAIGIAVLKYRLYDIDVVISRTMVFAGLAAFITAIYVSIVVGTGTLLGAGGEPNLALSIVATAVVAVAFQPVRERLTRIANRLVFGHRATPYEVLSGFAGDLAQTTTPASTLERMAKLVADGTGADRVFVWLRVGETARATAVWPEVFLLEPIPDRDLGDPTAFADFDHVEEVVHDGELLGAITLGEPRGEALNHTEHELLSDLAGQAALVLRNLRLTEELRARIEELHSSRRRLVRAQDDERRRLERDLHDGARQRLAELTRAVRAANESAEREGASQAASMLAQVAADGEEAIRTVRDLAHGIYPPVLAAEGLPGALAGRAAKAAVPMTIEADGLGRYDPDVEAAVYFCVLEAVNNAAKYAGPAQVSVRLATTNGTLTFEVSDDGDGFDPVTTPRGHGITNMADRLDALGGELDLDSKPGRGTVVRGRLPIGHDRSRIGTRP